VIQWTVHNIYWKAHTHTHAHTHIHVFSTADAFSLSENCAKGTRFGAAVLVQDRMAVTLQFWVTGDWYTICNICSKFLNKQSFRPFPK
jgi:hypothetical protein